MNDFSKRRPMGLRYTDLPCAIGFLNFKAPPLLDKMAATFADDIFKCMFVNEKFCILIKISLKFVPKGPIDNKAAFVQIMAWRRTGATPLPEPMLTQLNDAYIRHDGEMS